MMIGLFDDAPTPRFAPLSLQQLVTLALQADGDVPHVAQSTVCADADVVPSSRRSSALPSLACINTPCRFVDQDSILRVFGVTNEERAAPARAIRLEPHVVGERGVLGRRVP